MHHDLDIGFLHGPRDRLKSNFESLKSYGGGIQSGSFEIELGTQSAGCKHFPLI